MTVDGVGTSSVRGEKSRAIPVAVSAGVAAWEAMMEAPEAFVAAADRAMYRAKDLGGNRVIAANTT